MIIFLLTYSDLVSKLELRSELSIGSGRSVITGLLKTVKETVIDSEVRYLAGAS